MKTFIFLVLVSMIFITCKNQDNKTSTTVKTSAGTIYQRLNNADFKAKLAEIKDVQLVDVRTPREYEKGNIEGSKLVNYKGNTFITEINKLDKNRPTLVYCQAGGRSAAACKQMMKEGFKEVYELKSGYGSWK